MQHYESPPDIRALVKQAIETSDSRNLIEIIEDTNSGVVESDVLAVLLLTQPLPVKILRDVDKHFPINKSNVLANLGRFDQGQLDWNDIWSFLEQLYHPNPQVELFPLFEGMMERYVENEQRNMPVKKLRQGLLGILDKYPHLADSISNSKANPAYLLKLSAGVDAGDWLAKTSRLEDALYWGVRVNVITHMLLESPGLKSFESWMKQNPAHKKAWQGLRNRDEANYERHKRWMAKWVPDGKIPGSPLQAWFGTLNEMPDAWATLINPLDDIGEISFPSQREIAVKMAKQYSVVSRENLEGYSLHRRLRVINNNYIRETLGQDELSLDLGTNLFLLQMSLSQNSVKKFMSDPTLKEEMASLLEDYRLGNITYTWKINDVMRWATGKVWKDWKDSQGKTLVERLLDCGIDTRSPSPVLLSKLAKLHPQLVLDPQGPQLTNRLPDLDEDAKTMILRSALEGQSEAVQDKTKRQKDTTTNRPAM